MKGIYFTLAITACISHAEKAKFSKLLNLQNEVVDSLYEDAHESFGDYHHQAVEHNPYMDEYSVGFDHHSAIDHQPHGLADHTAFYQEQHGYEPHHHTPHYDVEHNPYEYSNYPLVVEPLFDEAEHHDAFGYETYRDFPHETVVPFAEAVYHDQVLPPVYHDDYEHHDPVYSVEVPVYTPEPYAYDHHDYHNYESQVHDDWHVEPVHLTKPVEPKHIETPKKEEPKKAESKKPEPKKDDMFKSMPGLSDQHIFSDTHLDCGAGMVQIGNRCMPAQSIVGDDHQEGGHHFREDTGSHHYYFSNEEGQDDE